MAVTLAGTLRAQAPPTSTTPAPATAEDAVHRLYELVTFTTAATPDWDAVRALFLPEAVIVLRTGRTTSTVFTVESFVADFVTFAQREDVRGAGFVERIVRLRPLVFRDVAQVLVLYEAHIPGSSRPPQQGVDSFSLVRRDGRWQIAAIVNDLPSPEHPVPAELRQ
ncbi:MAG: nuclear transport factor 2 family protein [Gemmatimonadota bacterium]|nr:nuclear transport factor 2 family protein [Gemmatimonadota bacterium]